MSISDSSAGSDANAGIRAWSLAAVIFVLVISLTVLVGGWILGSRSLTSLSPRFEAMAPSVAFGFTALAMALFCRLITDGVPTAAKLYQRTVAAIVGIGALANLFIISLGNAQGVDGLLWPGLLFEQDNMSAAASVCFGLAAVNMALVSGGTSTIRFPFVLFATAGLLISVTILVGYVFGASAFYEASAPTSMALHTALAFAALFIAMLLTHPARSWVTILLLAEPGSAVARRLFPVAVLLPIAFCLMTLTAFQTDTIAATTAMTLLAVVTLMLLAVAVLLNAAARNRAERELQTLSNELENSIALQDMLLRELRYRVRSNLQQIRALIHMELARQEDRRAKAPLRATAGRVHALGTVYRLLISGTAARQVRTGPFLNNLCHHIGADFDAGGKGITLHVVAEDIPVSVDVAIPIGMIVSEYLANSFRHSFRGRPIGDIWIEFTREANGAGRLIAANNGAPLRVPGPDTAGPDRSALHIIRPFVQQLRGHMTVDVDGGNSLIVLIPANFERRERD